MTDLAWLGLGWDEGPDIGGPYGPYRQSERLDRYAAAADRLISQGTAFRCFCSSDTGDAGRAAGHRDPCRALDASASAFRAEAGEPFAVRFRVPTRAPGGALAVRFADRIHGDVSVPVTQIPDAVVLRRDRRPTYNFAVVVDDVAMRIDLVLRGDDHLSNTPLQVLLYAALGERAPEFGHLPMVLGPDGERLSKRHGATSVQAWRERGVPPEALVNALALIGWAPAGDRTIVALDDVVAEFDLSRVSRSAAIFDPVKLEWISSQHIHAMPSERLEHEVATALVRSGLLEATEPEAAASWIRDTAEFLRPALVRFDQVPALAQPLFHPGGALGDEERAILADPTSRRVLEALAASIENERAPWAEIKVGVQAASGAKGKVLFQPIRIAVTGHAHGRELDGIVPLVAEGHRRIPRAVPALSARVARTLGGLP